MTWLLGALLSICFLNSICRQSSREKKSQEEINCYERIMIVLCIIKLTRPHSSQTCRKIQNALTDLLALQKTGKKGIEETAT